MADIERLPPAQRISPSRPTSGSGERERAPQRKPNDVTRHDQQRQRKQDDDASHIDEYA